MDVVNRTRAIFFFDRESRDQESSNDSDDSVPRRLVFARVSVKLLSSVRRRSAGMLLGFLRGGIFHEG